MPYISCITFGIVFNISHFIITGLEWTKKSLKSGTPSIFHNTVFLQQQWVEENIDIVKMNTIIGTDHQGISSFDLLFCGNISLFLSWGSVWGERKKKKKKMTKPLGKKRENIGILFSRVIYAISFLYGNMLKRRHSCKNEIK